MKKFALLFLCFFMVGFVLQSALNQIYSNWEIPSKGVETVHVFFEPYATNPALSQMILFARLPKSVKKIISWHRFPNRKNVLNLKEYNTTEIDIPAMEAHYKTAIQKVFTHVFDVYKNNPDTQFVLYVNFSHTKEILAPFYNHIPKKNIKRIHIFEDGYGEFFKSPFNPASFYLNGKILNDDDIRKHLASAFKNEIPWQPIFSSSIHKIYPVTYHIMHADIIKKDSQFKTLRIWWKEALLETIDFDKLKNTFTHKQKKIVYKLSGFDYDKFYSLMHGEKTLMFTLGYFYNKPQLDKAELNLLTFLKNTQLDSILGNEKYVWLFKPHPSLASSDKKRPIKALFKDIIEVPAQVPYEVFILADLKPTKTGGVGSSLYFSLKKGDILFYIKKTQKDEYLYFLKPHTYLTEEQIINLNNFTDDALKKNSLEFINSSLSQ